MDTFFIFACIIHLLSAYLQCITNKGMLHYHLISEQI